MKEFWSLTQRQRIERWENVVRVLKALTPHQRRYHWTMRYYVKQTDCGTIACAAWYCGLDPWFRRRGFNLIGPLGMGGVTEKFFGAQGCTDIFWNTTQRPVGQVIREVEAYLKELRRAPRSV